MLRDLLPVRGRVNPQLGHFPVHRLAVDLHQAGDLVHVAVMDAEQLEFPDASFDTVVSTLSTCTFPNPVKALQEMKRVCRKDGLILLLEHGHSSMRWLADYQDRHVLKHYQQHAGCRWNQDPWDLINAAGLKMVNSKRFGLGMFYSIEATPNS